MKNLLFAAAAATFVLAGCSQNEVLDQTKGSPIGFNILSETTSRATPITPANLTTKATDFQVWAYEQGYVVPFPGAPQQPYVGSTNSKGVKIKYTTLWDYDDPADLHYWPAAKLDFYAINPASAGTPAIKADVNAQKVTFEVDATNANQVDLMYAIKKDQLQSSNGGKVSMQFKHTLSQIVFKGITNLNNLTVEVKDITIHNLKYKGTFTFPADEATAATAASWALEAGLKNFAAGLAGPIGINKRQGTGITNTPIILTNETTGAFLLMPQTSEMWATTAATAVPLATAETNKQTYLKITLKYLDKGVPVYGTDTDYKDVYVPFKAEWEPGKRYIYTLEFGGGGGFDKDGKPVLNGIRFATMTVENWVDQTMSNTKVSE